MRLLTSITALALFAAFAPSEAQAQRSRHHRTGVSVSIGNGGFNVNLGHSSHRGPRDQYRGRHWVEGHWTYQTVRVQLPGTWRNVWCEPVYDWRYDNCGRRIRVCIQPGRYDRRWCPGEWVNQTQRVWVPGCWR